MYHLEKNSLAKITKMRMISRKLKKVCTGRGKTCAEMK
jgi:hypothetical protein